MRLAGALLAAALGWGAAAGAAPLAATEVARRLDALEQALKPVPVRAVLHHGEQPGR